MTFDVERLAEAMYSQRRRAFRREYRPTWAEMLLSPSAAHDPRRPWNATNNSVIEGFRDSARSLAAEYAALEGSATLPSDR